MCDNCGCAQEPIGQKNPLPDGVSTSAIELELVLLEEAVSCLADTIKYAFEVKDKDTQIFRSLRTPSELPALDYLKKAYREQLLTYSKNVKVEVVDILNRVNNVCSLFNQWEVKECVIQYQQTKANSKFK